MSHTRPLAYDGSKVPRIAAPTPTSWALPISEVRLEKPTGTSREPGSSESSNRRTLVLSVRLSFFLGAALVVAMLLAFYLWGAWVGAMFIPPLAGTYGLFLSSGKQLNVLDHSSYGSFTLSATHSDIQRR